MVMRKKTARILGAFGIAAAATLIFLASHEEKKNSVVNNCKGVTMTIEDGTVSEDGLVLDICNESENELTFEEDFILEKWTKGQWYKIPSQSLTHDWEDEPFVVEPHTVAEGACPVNWLEDYGKLPNGQYRLLKKFQTKDETEYVLAVTFSL